MLKKNKEIIFKIKNVQMFYHFLQGRFEVLIHAILMKHDKRLNGISAPSFMVYNTLCFMLSLFARLHSCPVTEVIFSLGYTGNTTVYTTAWSFSNESLMLCPYVHESIIWLLQYTLINDFAFYLHYHAALWFFCCMLLRSPACMTLWYGLGLS